MTDGDWLRLIKAQPRDDLLRLAYADWLEENGIGSFLRWRLLRGDVRDMAEEGEILQLIRDEFVPHHWCKVMPEDEAYFKKYGKGSNFSVATPIVMVRRGFVSRVLCVTEQWIADGRSVAAAHPVEFVHFPFLLCLGSEDSGWRMYWDGAANPFHEIVTPIKEAGHESEEAARRALSEFMIAWAKSQSA